MQTYLNDTLLKAGIEFLMKKAKDSFIETLSLYFKKYPEMIDTFFNGLLPINNEVKEKIENYIKNKLASPDYYKGNLKITLDIDYAHRQCYEVQYNSIVFLSKDLTEQSNIPSDEFPVEKVIPTIITIYSNDLV